MAVWNYGSINADWVYAVPHILLPGETLAARSLTSGLGGKGANQSAALARAGARVHHIGSVGAEGGWARDRLAGFGVETSRIRTVEAPTGHAIIALAENGENSIIIYAGANATGTPDWLEQSLSDAAPGDTLMLQNEVSCQPEAARIGQDRGLRVVYSAAPFDAGATRAVLDTLSLVLLNEVEARQLSEATGLALTDLPVPGIVVTRGAEGADWIDTASGRVTHVPAHKVQVADTTGAGDTFAGYLVAGLDTGLSMEEAMRRASAASALKVQRPGAADAVPALDEVLAFLG